MSQPGGRRALVNQTPWNRRVMVLLTTVSGRAPSEFLRTKKKPTLKLPYPGRFRKGTPYMGGVTRWPGV